MEKYFKIVYGWILWIRDTLLFGQWTKLCDFLKLAHSQSDEASSKRLYGGLIILNCLAVFDLFSKGVFPVANWSIMYPGWFTLLFIGAGMISLSVIEKVAQIIADVKINKMFSGKEPDKTDELKG